MNSKETVFVGANNSGKTSAIEALMLFLKKSKHKDIRTTDFTLSNWKSINKIGDDWSTNVNGQHLDLSQSTWEPYLPCIDVWLSVHDREIHYVSHLIPTLSWDGGPLGVRLILQPTKLEELCKDYKTAYIHAKNIRELWKAPSQNKSNEHISLNLWPHSMRELTLSKNCVPFPQ